MSNNEISTCLSSSTRGAERARFFTRQLITPDDLTQDQIYFRDKSRRHNRLLHGWGVVCGARVRRGEEACQVVVEPGYVLGPFGDEIVIDQEVTVDLCREGLDGNAASGCGDISDPWCSDVRVNRQAGQTVYVAVKYEECLSRPVRVQANGCGCDETECEYSRVRDSYAIKVLTSLPTTYADPMPEPDLNAAVRCFSRGQRVIQARLCPDCPSEPWVILADVTLESNDTVGAIDCFAHRRYVVSFGDYYFLCRPVREQSVGAVLEDRELTTAGRREPAPVLVRARRRDNSAVYIPANFTVEAGETVRSLLEREGNREFYDPSTGDSYRLRDLYSLAEVDPEITIDSVADAFVPLEGVTLAAGGLNDARTRLEANLVRSGLERLERDEGGLIHRARRLPATAIRGVSSESEVGRNVADLTVEDVAGREREAFIESATAGIAEERLTAARNQAATVWDRANEILLATRVSR